MILMVFLLALRAQVVKAVGTGLLTIPKSEDGRTDNVKSVTEADLKAIGIDKDTKIMAVVHTNDTHGRLLADDYNGIMGFAKVGAVVADLREKLNGNVVVLDAGDALHGLPVATISKGKAVVDVFNTIGYDGMTFGNHDYNYGYQRGLELQKEMKFPVLVANVVDAEGKPVYTPSTIKEVDGVKIGIFGLTTPETAYKSHPKNTEGLTIQDPVEVAKKMVAELEGKVDVIVALTHLGYQEGDYSSDKLAKAVDGIDLIVDGHSHTLLENGALVNDTMIVQANEHDKYLGVTYLTVAKDGKVSIMPTLLSTEAVSSYTDNKAVTDLLAEVVKTNAELTADVCGTTDVELVGERSVVRTGESNLGNLLTTAMLEASGAEIAFTNGGGIRASIAPGEINKGDIIEVLPFGNQLVLINVTGENMVKALEFGVSKYPEANGGFPHVAGITFKFDPEQPVGSRVFDVMVGGQPIDLAKTYKVATNDFLAAGGDGYEMLTDTDPNEYDALDEVLFDYIKANGVAKAVADGRVATGTKATEPTQPTEPVEPTEPAQPTEEVTYVVVAGDVLWRIAQKYNTTYQALAEYNKIANPYLIFVGQIIKIPAK